MQRVLCGMVLALGVLAVIGPPASTRADTIVQHTGVSDPTTEGFTLTSDANFRTSPDPLWQGEDAWWTSHYNNSARGSYDHALTGTDVSNMSARGWQAQIRVSDYDANDDGADYGIGLNLYTATRGFEIYVGTANNNPQVYQWDSLGAHLIAATTLGSGYHTYSLVAAAGDGATADVLVDGNAVATITGVAGTYANPSFGFGSYWSLAKFNADYSHVSLTVVPEPSTLILLCAGSLSLLAYAWRKRK